MPYSLGFSGLRGLAISSLVCFTLVASPVLAQSATGKAGEKSADSAQAFDISASSLAEALTTFGLQSGLQMSYSSKLVQGISVPAVKGTYSPREVLSRLLAGTQLEFRFVNGSVVVIVKRGAREQAAVDGGVRTLGPVRVEGAAADPYFGRAGQAAGVNGINGSRDITATEGTGSFTSGALTVGSKAPQALKDVPQSISVLTAERMEQQNITDFTTAMNQLPGVMLVQGQSSLENTFYSRGFGINSIQVDGGPPMVVSFRSTAGFGYLPLIDMSVYDHVELLRGASGLFNGYGTPSGTVNLVRKTPLDHSQITVEAQTGSWDDSRVVADATAPLTLDGRLRGRLVMTYQNQHYFYDTAKDNKALLYGIAEFDATPTTLLTAGANYTREDSVPWYNGLPRYIDGGDLKLPRSECLCFSWNRWSVDTTEIFAGIEQKLGDDWVLKLDLTHNHQQSTRKYGYSGGAINNREDAPVLNAGPAFAAQYRYYNPVQVSAEATLNGAFEVSGQRQEITIGANRIDSDGGGRLDYGNVVIGTAAVPYQPYPGGPTYYSGSPNGSSPTVYVFSFSPNDPLFSEPRDPLPSARYSELSQVQTVAYASLRLTAFDRLHLITGMRWSRYESTSTHTDLCTSIPTTGTPSSINCVGRRIGDAYNPGGGHYSGTDVSWPPTATVTFDVTPQLNAYFGYTDIYQSQANQLDRDLKPVDPITGSNLEAGLKWQAPDGRLNLSAAGFSIRQKGFATQDGVQDTNVTPEDRANGVTYYFVTGDGRRVLSTQIDSNHDCCYKSDPNRTYVSRGIDLEATGEIATGWQVAASYTFNRTRQDGSSFGTNDGLPVASLQPQHNYKLWTSYYLGSVVLSAGVNGQSAAYYAGSTCPTEWIVTNPNTGSGSCATGKTVPYHFTVAPYAVFSGRVDYRFSKVWAASLNLENIFDKTYYQTVSGTTGGNWYGAPRSFMASLRGKW